MLASMIAAVLFADVVVGNAPLDNAQPVASNAGYVNVTNKVRSAKRKRPKPKPKPREELTPVEAWHRFCRPGGKVVIQKDERQKPYEKEKPDPHKRKPRK